ncbi:hypothetical protein [Candidatus Sodalis pierantonius]|uniref:hypothetical protein n=1 Tax=Candidatus Sodalis pierantonii TaxID=1486991 RepID=UPI001F4649FF|nr:hypothetical protein [Candidatus Sodalis pierantonius]
MPRDLCGDGRAIIRVAYACRLCGMQNRLENTLFIEIDLTSVPFDHYRLHDVTPCMPREVKRRTCGQRLKKTIAHVANGRLRRGAFTRANRACRPVIIRDATKRPIAGSVCDASHGTICSLCDVILAQDVENRRNDRTKN